MEMSVEVLKGLGYPGSNALDAVRTFRDFDNQLLARTFMHRHDSEALMATERAAMAEFQTLFQQELGQGRGQEEAAEPSDVSVETSTEDVRR
jgi:CPA2 family monovalent cation:H+ antiporter-2/glutathione-regulated potassium-efflux system ancillary protein KefC/glutathione-regulated potassium-efflux system protein KefB